MKNRPGDAIIQHPEKPAKEDLEEVLEKVRREDRERIERNDGSEDIALREDLEEVLSA